MLRVHTHTRTHTHTHPHRTLLALSFSFGSSPTLLPRGSRKKGNGGSWHCLSSCFSLCCWRSATEVYIDSCLSTYSGGFGKFEGRGKGQYLWIYLQLLSCCFEANCKYLYPGDISLHQHDSLTDSITSSMYSMREASRNQSWGLLLEIPYTIRTRGYKGVQGFCHVRPAFSWHL